MFGELNAYVKRDSFKPHDQRAWSSALNSMQSLESVTKNIELQCVLFPSRVKVTRFSDLIQAQEMGIKWSKKESSRQVRFNSVS